MSRIVDEAIDYLNERNTHVPPLIAILAVIGLGRISRLAAYGMVALWIADQARIIDRDRIPANPKKRLDRMVDRAEEESFPASDPPAYSMPASAAPAEASNISPFRTMH